jgi:type III secretion system YscD/HrpQ family protein
MPAHLIAEEGPHRGLILNLEEGEDWVIGRDPEAADFVIEDSTVSRKHARLTKAPEGVYLKNMSRVNPTLVNDEEHPERVLLKEGDRVQIGNTVFLFSEEALPDLGAPPKKPKKKKETSGYDDIFGDLDTPEEEIPPPPAEERIEELEKEPEPEPEPIAEIPREEKPEPTAYDTIFEDTGGEEDLPFNLLSETPLLLKVISGPNAGAEIGIEKGRVYTIGKDPNLCDIVFQDLSVSRNHARLSVGADGSVEIEDLGSKNGTVVNGAPITEKKAITPQDLVAMGTTVFLVIDREAPQETIYSPIIPSYEAAKAPEPETAAPEPEEEAKPAKDWKRQPIPMKHLVAAGSLAAVFLIVFLSFFSLFKSKSPEIALKEPVSEIKDALEKFPAVQFSFNPASGKLFLVGHVLTGVDYQELRYRIGQIDFIASAEDNVVVDEGVSRMMNDILADNAAWRGVSIRAVEPGKFAASGYLPTNAEMTQLSEYLTVNFPYLDRLENQVVVEENLNAQLQGMIAAAGIGGVTFQLSNGEVILSGRYSNKMESEYEDLLKQINAAAGVTGVKNFAVASTPNQAAIDISQQYQVSGSSMFDGRGYSAILNGRIYTLGDAVDGMKITSIDPGTILLEKDGVKYKIDYTR